MRTPSRIGRVLVAALALVALRPSPAGALGMPADAAVQYYQQILRRNPADARNYYGLGDAYIRKGRETGDVTYFTLAEEALRKCLAIAPHLSGTRRHLAYVLYFRHAFDEAAVEATRAIALDPHDSHAYGILGDAELEVGQYAEAERTYTRMIGLETDLYALSRLSGLKALRGPFGVALRQRRNAAGTKSEGEKGCRAMMQVVSVLRGILLP